MHKEVCRLLIDNSARLIYTADRTTDQILETFKKENSLFYSEITINEKVAYELALTGSMAAKRTACIFSTQGLYEALDPLMNSAYTGTSGGFLILCLQETEEEVTPIGLFSKLPVIVAEGPGSLSRSIKFGYDISEKYEIPIIIQVTPNKDNSHESEIRTMDSESQKINKYDFNPIDSIAVKNSKFIKNPARWAATPQYRYKLHKVLNEKIKKIRTEFEQYEGNIIKISGGIKGIITDKYSHVEFYGKDKSILYISTVFPLPLRLVDTFLEHMDTAYIDEGKYPTIKLQISNRKKIDSENVRKNFAKEKSEEMLYGFEVIRDSLGKASSINMIHGIKKIDPDRKILAITFEDDFFHSGMPSFINTLYNGSSYVLLIMTNKREEEIIKIMSGFGFHNFFHIDMVSEIKEFYSKDELTVLFYRGIL